MSPRGVVNPDVREQLLHATERLLMREDAAVLSGRAVTREAGTAVGLLHNHFSDFDSFVAAFVLDRLRPSAATAEQLSDQVGEGMLNENLNDGLVPLLGPHTRVLSRLAQPLGLRCWPAPSARTQRHIIRARCCGGPCKRAWSASSSSAGVAHDADAEAAASASVATVHQQLRIPVADEQASRDLLPRVIAVVIGGIAPAPAETSGPQQRKSRHRPA